MKTYMWGIVAIVVLVLGIWAFSELRASTGETDQNTDVGRYMDIKSYVQNNISDLSPVKEQVGGTFYVTSIQALDGIGTVSYEDGHNAYVADFTYTIEADGKPTVTSFTIREQ